MLTVRNRKEDVLAGLTAGADDYVVKGAPIDEILARLEVGRRIVHAERSLRVTRGNRHLSFVDCVTGAHNLRYFAKQLARELARSQRYGHPLAILSCEIDRFARIIEDFGHESATAILRAFVARSESCIRTSSDWIARVGAGEFTVVLPETTPYGANRVAQKLHEAFATESVATSFGPLALETSIALIAADPSKRPDSVQRIEELLRTAHRGLPAKTAEDQIPEDAVADLHAQQQRTRSGNRLN
jgi:diguanylate cyclase (GGDEF)-like protein